MSAAHRLVVLWRPESWRRRSGQPLEVACDESGYEGENLIGATTDVFAHASVRLDSRPDPRVQVADILAGVARKIASDELNQRGDAELAALLRPYVDACSTWGDDRSWSLLGPASTAQS